MKRSTVLAVLVTAAVLVVAGQLPLLRAGREQPAPDAAFGGPAARPRPTAYVRAALERAAVSLRGPQRRAASLAPSRAGFSWRVPRFAAPGSPSGRPEARTAVALAAVLAVAAGATAAAWRRSHDRRGRVYQMARRGLAAERIARRARVPQDAVRTLLTPGVGARR